MEKLDFNVAGMHCGSCATGIQMVVSQIDGVKSVFVDYDTKKGTVEFDGGDAKKAEIFKAIKELGYTAS